MGLCLLTLEPEITPSVSLQPMGPHVSDMPVLGLNIRGRFDSNPSWSPKEASMRCESCGNDYDKAFQVILAGKTHTFDSFECAIHKLAPACQHCGTRIVGHALEKDARFFCCAHCAAHEGVTELRDRA
jgi:hypothetical protein